jgi:hypothetical protein
MLIVGAIVALLLFNIVSGPSATGAYRANSTERASGTSAAAAASAMFSLTNFTANNTTVDVSMPFNISVDVVDLTGAALNASNYTFTWAGLPPFVPGTPGSGCSGPNGDNNSSVLNCTAAAADTFPISVTATNFTGVSNATSGLSIVVNPLPAITSFKVSETNLTLGTQIWFNVTSTGGTAPVNFSYTGLPLGCSGSTNSFSCTPTQAGVYNVTVTAVDSYGYTSAVVGTPVTVKTVSSTSTTKPGIGSTGWAIVIGIVIVGGIATIALLFQARREERAGRMGMEQAREETPPESGEQPPSGPPG